MRPLLLSSALASLMLCAAAGSSPLATPEVELADAAQITAPAIGRRDQPVKINHPAGATVQAIYVTRSGDWAFLPERHFVRSEKFTILAAPPSTYLVTTGDSTILKIVEDGEPNPQPGPEPEPEPKPDPKPDPSPGPEPGPAPVVAEWAVWIEEQQERAKHVDETAVMTDAAVRRDLEDRGLKVRIYDDDQPEAEPLVSQTKGVRPAFLLLDVSGKTRCFPAPKSREALEKIIRENVVR